MKSLIDVIAATLYDMQEPANATEILNHIRITPHYSQYISGKTPRKTIQSRISTDIAIYGSKSRFYRIAPSVFGLCSLRESGVYPKDLRRVYLGARRRRQFDHLYIGCVENNNLSRIPYNGIIPQNLMPEGLLRHMKILFRDKKESKNSHLYAKLRVFYFISCNDSVIKYERTEYDDRDNILKGSSIGFGTWVTENDVSLFSPLGIDIEGAVIRDFADFFSFMGSPALNLVENVSFYGFVHNISIEHDINAFGILYNVALSNKVDFDGRLGIRNLHWVRPSTRANFFPELERWSRYLVNHLEQHDFCKKA